MCGPQANAINAIKKLNLPCFALQWVEEFANERILVALGKRLKVCRFPRLVQIPKELNFSYVRHVFVRGSVYLYYLCTFTCVCIYKTLTVGVSTIGMFKSMSKERGKTNEKKMLLLINWILFRYCSHLHSHLCLEPVRAVCRNVSVTKLNAANIHLPWIGL